MIIQEIYLEKYKWNVLVFYGVDDLYTDVILSELEAIGCTKEDLEDSKKLLDSKKYNIGLTVSSFEEKASVMVIGITDSPEEFNNTYDHEKGHLAMHICIEYGINPFSEEYQYLVGEIGEQLFKVARFFLCDECKKQLIAGLK
jgi:hypothetical protein